MSFILTKIEREKSDSHGGSVSLPSSPPPSTPLSNSSDSE